jgi:Flp pilus assembly protein TadG
MAVSQLHHIKNSRGQTIVEFALVVSLLLAVLFGIVELGRLWWYSNHLNNSVRAGARHASVISNATSTNLAYLQYNVKTFVFTELSGFVPRDPDAVTFNNISVTVFRNGSSTQFGPVKKGDTIKVSVGYRFTVLSGKAIPYISGTKSMKRSASMLFE